MSEIPPPNNPNENQPPPQYAAYPRGASGYPPGSADKVKALSDGYFGLSYVFLANLVLAFGCRGAQMGAKTPEEALGIYAGAALVVGLIVGFLSYPQNKKIGFGMDWPPGNSVLASVLMGINSAICCGIIGYAVMQTIALNRIKTYGIKGGMFGIRKKDILARIEQIRAEEAGVPFHT